VGIKELKYFSIFSRWGQLVFKTSTPGKGWDGTLNGTKQNPGAFVWNVEAIDFNGHAIIKRGTVILVR
jgi:gliding motility-associated-like protein